MRGLGMAIAALGLAVGGLVAPATTAQADDTGAQAAGCESAWPGRDGNFRAWTSINCTGVLLGEAVGDDPNWADGAGPFRTTDNDTASSIMNSGYLGGQDVVAVYLNTDYRWWQGYGCLAPGEFYADNLSDNYYLNASGQTVNNSISAHAWVTSAGCGAGSWIT